MYYCTTRERCFSTRLREPEVPLPPTIQYIVYPPSYTIQSDCSSTACVALTCSALTNFQCKSLHAGITIENASIGGRVDDRSKKVAESIAKSKPDWRRCIIAMHLIEKPGQHLQSSECNSWNSGRRGGSTASGSSRTKTVHVACLFQAGVGAGGVVRWWRETSPKNLVDLFSESEQAARSVCAAGQLSKKLLFHQNPFLSSSFS